MAGARLDPSVLRETIALVTQHGSVSAAARESGIPYGTLLNRHRAAQALDVPPEPPPGPPAKPFEVADLPTDLPDAADLLAWRKRAFERKHKAAEARKLIPIMVKCDGPIGIAHFGDPHVDDDGTDIARLEQHVALVNRTEGLFGANVGDYRNNWIGRLARLWAQQSTSARDALVLTRWLLESMRWLYLVGGNHDAWSGEDDPVAWIAEQTHALHQAHACRVELQFPNGRRIRINARHDFKGHSMYNTAHGPAKAAQTGWRDHLLTCGHTHVSGYQVVKDPASGLISHCLRVASYKVHDRYAIESGLPDQNIFMCPVTVIDPRWPDDDPRLVTTIFDPDMGAEFLTWLRARK